MGADKPDIDNLKLVLHRHDQPIGISLYVENDTVVAKNTRRAVRRLDVLWAFPCGFLSIPRSQSTAGGQRELAELLQLPNEVGLT
jgi:hypothetical protein